MRRAVMVALLSMACSDQAFSPRPEPQQPPRASSPRGLAPDGEPGAPITTVRLGVKPDRNDYHPPEPPVCPQRRLESSPAEARRCGRDRSPLSPATGIRVKWDAGTESRPHAPETIVLPAWASMGHSDRSSVVTFMNRSLLVHVLDGDGGTTLDASVRARSLFSAWLIDDDGRTVIHSRSVPRPAQVIGSSELYDLPLPGGELCLGGVLGTGGWAVDLDGDTMSEFFYGGHVFALDGSEVGRSTVGEGSCHPGLFDVDGDGRLDLVMGAGVSTMTGETLCRVDPYEAYGHPDGAVYLLDIDADEVPEVLVVPKWQRDEPRVGRGKLRLQSLDCKVSAQFDAADIDDKADRFNHILHIAPFIHSERPAIVAEVFYPSDSGRTGRAYALFDHNLEFRGFIPLTSTIAVDLNGDGLYDLIGGNYREFTTLDEHEHAVSVSNLYHFDPRTGVTTTLSEDFLGNRCRFVDADLDGHGELICQSRRPRSDDTTRLIAFEPDGEPWAPAWHFHHEPFIPYLYLPDGHFNPLPPSWRDTGMYRAMPSVDITRGTGSDLVARIADVCSEECERGWWTVWPQIGNIGEAHALRPVRLDLFGRRDDAEVLLHTVTVPHVQAGRWLPADPVRVPAADYTALRAVVSGDGWEPDECDTTNNDDVWTLECP